MNTVRANITSSRYAETNSIFQYDTGRKLEIYGCNLPKSVEVQFSTDKEKGNTITRVGNTNNGVTTTIIPNQLLNDSEKTSNFCIFAFLYNVDNDGGRTEYVIKIPVVARPKPENPSEEPLPEPNIFHETVEAVNASADRAENALKETKEIRDNLNLDLSEKITRPQTAEVGQVLAVKEIDESGKPTVFEAEDVKVPTKTSELENDSGFLTEHQDISGKLDKDKLPEAIDDALAQAKESGEFDGEPGPKGDPGETTYIENPYDDTKIKKEIASKVGYSEVVGNQLLMYADDTKEKLLATLELPSGVEDVKVKGTSIVENGIAEIPLCTTSKAPGLIAIDTYSNSGGLYRANNDTGLIRIAKASDNSLAERGNEFCPVVPRNLDYAVKCAMCDGKGATWTAEEQTAARERMGIGEWELIADVTLEEDVNSYKIQTQYGYKQIKVFLDNVEDGTNGSFYSYGIIKRVNGNYQGAITITYGDLSTRYRYGYIGMECINENVIAVTESSVRSSKDAIYGIYNFPCFKQSWYYSDKLYGIAFTPVKEADILKTGTKIQVYGVRV